MITRILVPMDDSEMAERALEYALNAHPEAAITVLHVTGEPSPMMGKAMSIAIEEDLETAAQKQAQGVLERAREIAADHDIGIDTAIAWGRPSRQILDRADEYDTVVIGSHNGSLIDRLFVGNVAERITRRSSVPVTVVR